MAERKPKQAPIRQCVRVECPIEDAFRLFLEGFGKWWPLASYSITGEEANACAIEPWAGGRVFERTASGAEHDWGSVITWDPPRRVGFTWRDESQRVEIDFRADAGGTRVTLVHTGWEFAGVETCVLMAA